MKKKDTTILLVDDELDILEIIGYNLTAQGWYLLAFFFPLGVVVLVINNKFIVIYNSVGFP